ncbi:cytochrome P450 [Byssothecium circinans]|uniref:Cytochrome P450 n=1 Tax=Byssothecium circinans TaxID=147558 RepID=A0A6A5UA82_9PLEO|nr:cytochrome P450 [Byssothecium circinans]
MTAVWIIYYPLLYRILLHPLANFPGPFLAKFSDWYGAFHALRKDLHETTLQDHQRYDIYRSEAFSKSKVYMLTQSKPNVHSVFSALDKRIHRSRRKIVSSGLSEKSIRRFEPTMDSQIEIYLQLLKDSAQSQQPVNMTVACKYLALDVSSLFGFGSSLELQTNNRNRFITEGMEASMYRTNIHMQYPLSKYLGVDTFLLPFLFSIKERYKKALKGMIADRLAITKDAREDLFSFVTDIKDPETGDEISQNDLFAEAEFFLPAGGQTTSSAIAALLFYLSRYPACYKRLANEIRTRFTDGSQISHSALSTCAYLRACIDEALRMSPPAPGTLWREIPRSYQERVVVDGHVIPHGVLVGVNIYAIHHNEDYFPDPSNFRPERFLSSGRAETLSEKSQAQHLAFSPFSIGTRGCMGKALAYMEISLVIAKTLWYFDFDEHSEHSDIRTETQTILDSASKESEEFKIHDQLIATHDGPCLLLRPTGKL